MLDPIDAGLRDSLTRILAAGLEPNEALDARLRSLPAADDTGAEAELIFLATHLRFSKEDARNHWRSILEHRDAWQGRLGEPVDLRAAMLSYFVRVHPRLQNPKIVELELFDRTVSSSYRDELTGLYNFRFLEDYLGRELGRSERHGAPLSLVMLDLDDFKHFNDTWGHELGNRALADFGRLTMGCLRGADVAVRFGGEEFALILPDTRKVGAHHVAERVREAVETQRPFPVDGPPRAGLTVSAGVATFPGDAADRQRLLSCADHALYAAKRDGKNRVALYADGTRSFRRKETSLPGRCDTVHEHDLPVTVVLLSEGGMLLRSPHDLPVGVLVDVRLQIPGAPRPVQTSGRVVASSPTSVSEYEAGVNIIDMPGPDRALLTGYLRGAA